MVQSFFVFLILIPLISIAHADTITLAGDEWCPINCNPNSDHEGFMVDIARQVFAEKGHVVEYKIIPWNRSLQMARSDKINGVVGSYVEDCPDFVFPENEQALIGFSFFVKEDSPWVFSGMASLGEIRLGVAANYSYGDALDRYIEQYKQDSDRVQINYGNTPVENNLRKLLTGRIDAVVST